MGASARPAATGADAPRLGDRLAAEGIDGRAFLAAGRAMADGLVPGDCPFLAARGIAAEIDDKRAAMAQGRLTFHAQIGYRALADSVNAWREIHDRLAADGMAPDRYGICLDWSMGVPAAARARSQRGTGLILEREADFSALTAAAPVAPHFGDFVLGMPAAVDNARAALRAGSTTIGNLSQYFTFRLPGHDDDIAATRATVEALGFLSASGREILVHSNLDDGFAAFMEDMGSALGMAILERRIVEDLAGLPLGHCYGHTFSEPVPRLAFRLALARANPTPGTMVYGNTTLYGGPLAANYGALASYLLIDAMGERLRPTGAALTPIPVTEAERIPTVEEVVDAHRAARRLAARVDGMMPLVDPSPAEALAERLLARGEAFAGRVLDGLTAEGVDVDDPAALMLALRRVGPVALETRFGAAPAAERVPASWMAEIRALADAALAATPPAPLARLRERPPTVVVAASDVHFYGKRLVETTLAEAGAVVVDAAVSAEPDAVAEAAAAAGADAVAVSTYNGIALTYVRRVRAELSARGLEVPVFVGGRLNEIVDEAGGPLPVEVGREIAQLGARPCATVEAFLEALADLPRRRTDVSP